MAKEATVFRTQILNCQKAIRGMKTANEAMLNTVKQTMSAPLPLVYDETARAAGSQLTSSLPIGGTVFSAEEVAAAAQEAGHQLESQVLVPIQKWLDSCAGLMMRYRELDRLRLEVDSRKRTGADAKAQYNLDRTVARLQHKEGKLKVASDSFDHQEALLYRDLSNLIKDAQWLKHHVQLALRTQGEALSRAAYAFGELPPMPAAPAAAPEEAATVAAAAAPPAAAPPAASAKYRAATPAAAAPPPAAPPPPDYGRPANSPAPAGPPTPNRDPAPLAVPPAPAFKHQPVQHHPADNPFATL
eukprot:scaffold8.g1444.t1